MMRRSFFGFSGLILFSKKKYNVLFIIYSSTTVVVCWYTGTLSMLLARRPCDVLFVTHDLFFDPCLLLGCVGSVSTTTQKAH